MLHEEGSGGERGRAPDVPVCFAVCENKQNDAFHLVVSYSTLMMRWWQVGLTAGKMLSQVSLPSALTHIAAFDWPLQKSQGEVAQQVEKPKASPNPAGPSPRPFAKGGRVSVSPFANMSNDNRRNSRNSDQASTTSKPPSAGLAGFSGLKELKQQRSRLSHLGSKLDQ